MWSSTTAPPPPPPSSALPPPPPPVPPPSDPNLKHRIDTLALFAARNGPAFVDYTRQQQGGNPDFAFLEPGSGAEGASYFDYKLYEALFEMAMQEAEANANAFDAAAVNANASAADFEVDDDDGAVAAEVAEAMREEEEAAKREASRSSGGTQGQLCNQQQSRFGGGVGSEQRKQEPPPPKPNIDAFDLPAGLIPELVNAARTRDASSFKPLTPIPAADAEAAAKVAEREFPPRKVFGGGGGGEEEDDGSDESETERVLSLKLSTPYLSARLAALEAELEAYVPGMTRADLEEKLAKARGFGGGSARRGGISSATSTWEELMRRRAAEAASTAAAAVAASRGTGKSPAPPGDDGRFEGPRWLDRAGVGFEYRGGGAKKMRKENDGGGGFAAAGAAAATAAGGGGGGSSSTADPASLLLDADLATFREQRSRQYHSEGNPRARRRREQQQRR